METVGEGLPASTPMSAPCETEGLRERTRLEEKEERQMTRGIGGESEMKHSV